MVRDSGNWLCQLRWGEVGRGVRIVINVLSCDCILPQLACALQGKAVTKGAQDHAGTQVERTAVGKNGCAGQKLKTGPDPDPQAPKAAWLCVCSPGISESPSRHARYSGGL